MSTSLSNLIDNLTEKLYQKNVTLANVFLIMEKLKIICYYALV